MTAVLLMTVMTIMGTGCISGPVTQESVTPDISSLPPSPPSSTVAPSPVILSMPTNHRDRDKQIIIVPRKATNAYSKAPPVHIHNYDWSAAVEALKKKMDPEVAAEKKGSIIISRFCNQSTGTINLQRGQNIFIHAIDNGTSFIAVSSAAVKTARKQLHLTESDSLQSRRKAFAIGKKAGADYVMYNTVKGNVSSPVLKSQIVRIRDGIILFSSSVSLKEAPLRPL